MSKEKENVLRLPAELLYAKELEALKAEDKNEEKQ